MQYLLHKLPLSQSPHVTKSWTRYRSRVTRINSDNHRDTNTPWPNIMLIAKFFINFKDFLRQSGDEYLTSFSVHPLSSE